MTVTILSRRLMAVTSHRRLQFNGTAVQRLRRSSTAPSFDSFLTTSRSFSSAQPMLDSAIETSNSSQAELVERVWNPPKDPWDLQDVLESSSASYEQLFEWDSQYVSRTSLEQLKLYKNESRTTLQGVPTLTELAAMPLPPPDPSLTETDNKIYALQRKRKQYQYICQQVELLADSRVDKIRALTDWQEKQEAVDVLFEEIEAQLVAQEDILGKHPSFGKWVERALEEYLQRLQNPHGTASLSALSPSDGAAVNDADAMPIFIDCLDPSSDTAESVTPKILHPLQTHPNPHATTAGMMVEEWELAAHKATKRIMLRQSTRKIARAMMSDETSMTPARRVLVHGAQGVGKTAALAAIVASVRVSGAIVLYMPNGDDLHKNGFYLEANEKRPGMFDLPILAKKVCADLLTNHEDALRSLVVSKDIVEDLCTSEQLAQLAIDDDISAAELLKLGVAKSSQASIAFSAVVEALLTQDQVDFVMALDEFNCYFEKGHYFHGDYEDAKKPVPYDQISLFAPALRAMAVSSSVKETDLPEFLASNTPRLMKRGAIIVALTESHAIARKITDALTANATDQQFAMSQEEDNGKSDIQVVKIPKFSKLEVDHILANFEATGVGKLRLDRGETVRNEQEVARLRMLSDGVGQRLLDACIIFPAIHGLKSCNNPPCSVNMKFSRYLCVMAAVFDVTHSFSVTSSSRRTLSSALHAAATTLEGRKIKGDVVPLNNFILVRVADPIEQTDGGILLTGKAKIRKTLGTVVSIGPGRVHQDSGLVFPMPVQPGAGVVYGKYDGTEVNINGTPHTLIQDNDILVKFDGEELTEENVEVVSDNVLVEVDIKEQTTEGGILIAKVGKGEAKPSTGTVVKVGPGRMAANGELMPMEVAAGDTIKFRDFAGNEVQIGEKEFRVVKMPDILAKF